VEVVICTECKSLISFGGRLVKASKGSGQRDNNAVVIYKKVAKGVTSVQETWRSDLKTGS